MAKNTYARIHVDMKNVAFANGRALKALGAVLRQLARQVENGCTCRRILDANGSYCGKFEVVGTVVIGK